MNDEALMAMALSAANLAIGRTSPNPPVGAVIVRDDMILGEGHTQPAGGPHAEVMAIANARRTQRDLRGTTMVVTLEPCCHHGKTPPCTDAIIASGISRVVIGVVDPFHAVAGGGIRALEAAGIEVRLGVGALAAARSMRGFLRVTTGGLPEVTAKVAVSLDGHLATASGESRWISGEMARRHVHLERARHDAVAVGIGTVLADDPRLNVRLENEDTPDPVPVVFDTQLQTPSTARLLQSPRRAIIVTGPTSKATTALNAEIVRVPLGRGGHLDLRKAMRALGERGLHRVLVEGGASIHRALFDDDLVDHLHLYLASVMIPGGRPWLAGAPLEHLAHARRLQPPTVTPLGVDVLLHYEMQRDEGGAECLRD